MAHRLFNALFKSFGDDNALYFVIRLPVLIIPQDIIKIKSNLFISVQTTHIERSKPN